MDPTVGEGEKEARQGQLCLFTRCISSLLSGKFVSDILKMIFG
jgi:hypothetical protein